MSLIRAVVVDPEIPERLALKEVEAPQPLPSEALVKVDSISLNRGEVLGAMHFGAGWRPGWDLAGTVIQQAANGSGPKVGTRVVGGLGFGAWAEQVAVPTSDLAEIPEKVSFAEAATLPVAGLTALRALEKGGLLLNKRVLITGSTGGVGLITHQLAKLNGAFVVGQVRQESNVALVREAGADEVVVGEDVSAAGAFGPYELIIDSVGGKTLETTLLQIAPGGSCVMIGWSASPKVTIDVSHLIRITGRTTLYGMNAGTELNSQNRAQDYARLVQLVADRKLKTYIEVEASWHQIGSVAQRLLQRQFTGKAVLHID